MTIDKWGPSAWNTLHSFAHAAPPLLDTKQQQDMLHLLNLFGAHLPCPTCRRHFHAYLDTHVRPETFTTRESIVRFLHDAHNDVNLRLGKRVWTLKEHYRVYAVISARSTNDSTSTFDIRFVACAGVVAIIAAISMVRRRGRDARLL